MVTIGIDLGTTNSVAAHHNDGNTRTLASGRADHLVPSVVCWRKGNILVGQTALDYAYKDPRNAVASVKRLMGRAADEPKVEEIRGRVTYEIFDSGEAGLQIRLGDKGYTPIDISAMILKSIKANAEADLGIPVTHAVITVPAYFEERQRAATRKAGEEAGLIVKRIIDEPSAAAIAYGYAVSKGARKRLLVFDLGGGTFDVSIILTVIDDKTRNHFQIIEISGNNDLGGDDFDTLLLGEMAKVIQSEYGGSPLEDPMFRWLARQSAEKAKIALGSAESVDITLPATAIYRSGDGRIVDLEMTITRQHFDDLIRPLVGQCMQIVNEALHRQNLTPQDIDVVLLVGGSTLVPQVRDAVTNLFGADRVRQETNPFHAVALGAGILAATLQGVQCAKCNQICDDNLEKCSKCGNSLTDARSVGSNIVVQPTAQSFGISAVRGDQPDVFEVLIEKGTTYPLRTPKTRTFITTAQSYIYVPVFEGMHSTASRNTRQGVIRITQQDFRDVGLDVPAGTAVEIAMNLDRDRKVYVRVSVHGTPIQREFYLQRGGTQAASPTLHIDKLREILDNLLGVAEDLRNDFGSFLDAKEEKRLTACIESAQKALEGESIQIMRQAADALSVALSSCGAASVLQRAERFRSGASQERAATIQGTVEKIRVLWQEGKRDEASPLVAALRLAIEAERHKRRDIAFAGRPDYDGMLKVIDR